MSKLNESRTLRTPVFSGTNEESLSAARSWLNLVTCLRNVTTDVIDYNNQVTILQNLQTEIQELLGEVKNSSNTAVTNNNQIPTMVPPEYAEDECCDNGLSESQINDLKRLANIKSNINTKTKLIEGKLNATK